MIYLLSFQNMSVTTLFYQTSPRPCKLCLFGFTQVIVPYPLDICGIFCCVAVSRWISTRLYNLLLPGLKTILRINLDSTLWNPAASTSPGCFRPRCFAPGNSHSHGPCPLLAIPDAPPACILRGTRIVAGPARSLRFPTFACLLPPQAAAGFAHRARVDGNLSKYNVRTYLRRTGRNSFHRAKK